MVQAVLTGMGIQFPQKFNLKFSLFKRITINMKKKTKIKNEIRGNILNQEKF